MNETGPQVRDVSPSAIADVMPTANHLDDGTSISSRQLRKGARVAKGA